MAEMPGGLAAGHDADRRSRLMPAGKRLAGQRLPKSQHPVFSMLWLLERSQINEMSGCWEWDGARNRFGYAKTGAGGGITRTNWFQRYAHREAWAYINGPVPDGLCVLHRCDNPPCVNPAHLFLGTMQDNSVDMCRKKRHGRKKLTEQDVASIRRSKYGCRILAKKYQVTSANIQAIRSGKTWKWLPADRNK